MKRVTGFLAIVMLNLATLPALAADANDASPAPELAAAAAAPAPMFVELPRELKRPGILPALYISFGAVQAWDIYSTRTALKSGGRELNPLMKPVAGNSGAMIAAKAASTVSTIYFAEKLWRKNRVAAVVVVAAINGATAAISMHNARVSQNGR